MAHKGEPLFPIFNWQRALLCSNLPKETKAVGWALSTFTNKHGGNAHPGEARLASLLSMTTRTVRTHLTRLRADGFIIRIERGSIAERRAWADVYQLSFPDATTGREFPEVPADHRKPASADPWAADYDHRKSSARPPETERTDHRKLASAQQRSASTHTYKASESSDPARRASATGDEDSLAFDPWSSDEERFATVEEHLGGWLGPGEEMAIDAMIERGERLAYILGVISSRRPAA